MTLIRPILIATVCLAALFAPAAPAQTQPYTVIPYSGDGQMVCTGCVNVLYQFLEPMQAQVLDANGNPVQGVTVSWFPIQGNGSLSTLQTVTDSNGLATNTYTLNFNPGVTGAFVTNKITASIGNGTGQTTVFYQTQLIAQPPDSTYSESVTLPNLPASESGPAGSPATAIVVETGTFQFPTPGVEVRLLYTQTTGNPVITCAPQPGPVSNPPDPGTVLADPGTVLTNSAGAATCNPILSGSGSGYFQVLVGGVATTDARYQSTLNGGPIALFGSNKIPFSVTPAVPGSIQVVTGNGQTVTAGQALPTTLVALVKDSNGNPLTGQNVTWSVSPSNAGSFTNTVNTSGTNGQVQTGFTFASTANGNATITVAIAGNSSINTSFTATAVPLVTITSLLKIRGDAQTAKSGQAFATPLVVQLLNSNSQPASGQTVNFTVMSGPVSVSAPTAQTDNNGMAQITLTANANITAQASATVTAAFGNIVQNFSETVVPAGPTLTAGGFVNAADQQVGFLSPCSLATVSGAGIAPPNTQGTVVGAAFGAGPLNLLGNSLTVGGIAAPIFSVSNSGGQQSMTFQVPCEATPGNSVPVAITAGGGNATVNIPILAASPGIYASLGTDGVLRAVLVRLDGSFVTVQNPARIGDTVTAFVTGMGATTPQVATNQLPDRGTFAVVNGKVIPGIGTGGVANLSSALPPQLTADLVGVYQVSFDIPANSTPGDVPFSIGVMPIGSSTAMYSKLVFIPVSK